MSKIKNGKGTDINNIDYKAWFNSESWDFITMSSDEEKENEEKEKDEN